MEAVMISAVSSLGAAYSSHSYATGASSSGGKADVMRLEKEVSAKQSELDETECADTKPRLEAELRTLQAELSTAEAKETASKQGDDDPNKAADNDNASDSNHRFSGESDRIGSKNFDEDTPFGERVAYL